MYMYIHTYYMCMCMYMQCGRLWQLHVHVHVFSPASHNYYTAGNKLLQKKLRLANKTILVYVRMLPHTHTHTHTRTHTPLGPANLFLLVFDVLEQVLGLFPLIGVLNFQLLRSRHDLHQLTKGWGGCVCECEDGIV